MARIEIVVGIATALPGCYIVLTNRIYAGGDHPTGHVIERAWLTKTYNRRKQKRGPIPKFARSVDLPVP